jgi:hypothetical protein
MTALVRTNVAIFQRFDDGFYILMILDNFAYNFTFYGVTNYS